jgi:hypothetical protein
MDNQKFSNGKLLSECLAQYNAFNGEVNVDGMNTYFDIFKSQFKFNFFADIPQDMKIYSFSLDTDKDQDVSLIVKYKFEFQKKMFWWELHLIGNNIDKNEIKFAK